MPGAVAEAEQSAGAHFGAFTSSFLRHTKGSLHAGHSFALEPWEQEWADEALELDEEGRRVYARAGLVIPRKNGKTTLASALALYCGGPADGEPGPHVILCAASKENAGQLYDQCSDFIAHPRYGSPELSSLYVVQKSAILCPEVGGIIKRVSADGNLQHGLDPYVVLVDELHAFKTPKHFELWRAVTTAQGAREDPLVLFITTAGQDRKASLLGQLMDRVRKAPDLETERRRRGLTVYRSRGSRLLIYEYAIKAGTKMDDLDEWKAANPARHRTRSRIAEDLADALTDEATKRRLFGNEWAEAAERWIKDEWIERARREVSIPDGGKIVVAIDVGLTHDTTSVNIAHRLAPEDPEDPDELPRVVHRAHVFSARRDAPHHELHPGEVDIEEVEDYIVEHLGKRYRILELAYDPRFFADTAQRLRKRRIRVAEFTQSSPAMYDATEAYYRMFKVEQTICLPGGEERDPVFEEHIANTAAIMTERGHKLRKLLSDDPADSVPRPIDACVGSVMANWRALHATGLSVYAEKPLKVLG